MCRLPQMSVLPGGEVVTDLSAVNPSGACSSLPAERGGFAPGALAAYLMLYGSGSKHAIECLPAISAALDMWVPLLGICSPWPCR